MSEKKKDEENIYSKYILNKKDGCGKNRKNEEILYSATELNEDIENDFKKLKVSRVILKYYSESTLTKNRINRSIDNESRCPKHCEINGIYWRQPKFCQHPNHQKLAKGKKSCNMLTASF